MRPRVLLVVTIMLFCEGAFAGIGYVLDDFLPEVTLNGTIITVPPDTTHSWTWYLLDTNGDGNGDYHLLFGPPSYNPQGGAQRPSSGDQITVVAGLFGCETAATPMMLVYQLNGQFWRENGDGTTGNAGSRGFTIHRCMGQLDSTGSRLPQELPRIQSSGYVIRYLCWPVPENPPGIEEIWNYGDTTGGWYQYFGNFGRYGRYELPQSPDDSSCFVGGLMATEDTLKFWIVMYEWDGNFIREPGDTLNLVFQMPESAEPVRTGEPVSYLTAHNYPNPFNAVTTINYSLPESGHVSVSIFDLAGREVAKLMNGTQEQGSYAISWNGSGFGSGIYFYRVRVNGLSTAGRMVLLK